LKNLGFGKKFHKKLFSTYIYRELKVCIDELSKKSMTLNADTISIEEEVIV
jgi:hypothetical protein